MGSAANKGSGKRVVSEIEAMMRKKAYLYARAVDQECTDGQLGERIAVVEENLVGEYGKFRQEAQEACIKAVSKHFEEEVKNKNLNKSQKAALEKLELLAVIEFKKLSELSESEFAKKFAKIIDVIKMNPKRAEEFFNKDGNALLFGLTAKAQELRTTEQQVKRTLAIIMLTTIFCVGIAIVATAAAGLAIPASLGISAAASLGIDKVALVLTAVVVAQPAVQASLVASGLAGLGMACAAYVGRFPEDTSSKIQSAMQQKDAKTFEAEVKKIKGLKM